MRVCLLLLACCVCLPGLTKDFYRAPNHLITTQYPGLNIVASGAPNPGETIRFDLYSLEGRNRRYQVASSLGPGPIRCGRRWVPLALDPVFLLSVSGQVPNVFEGYAGMLDEQGRGVARLHLPRSRALIGLRLYTAFVTLESGAATREAVFSASPAYVLSVVKA